MRWPFFPIRHVPKYSRTFLHAVRTPAVSYFIIAGNMMMLVAIGLFYYFEAGHNPDVRSLFDALWWGLSTVTTVGYGDITPVTTMGRIIGLGLMAAGVLFFVCSTAILVSVFFDRTKETVIEGERLAMAEYAKVMAELSRLHERLTSIENTLAKGAAQRVNRPDPMP